MKPENFQIPDDIPKGTEEYKNWKKMIKEILEVSLASLFSKILQ